MQPLQQQQQQAALRTPFAFAVDQKIVPAIVVTNADKQRALSCKLPHLAISESELEQLTSNYLQWRQSFSTTFGGVRRNRLRKASAVALSKRNSCFLAGLCAELGMFQDEKWSFSFDFLAIEQFVRPLVEVLTARTKSQRSYQLLQELRHMIIWTVERAYSTADHATKNAFRLESFPCYSVVKAAVEEAAADKKAEERRNLARDEQELVELGKYIPLEHQIELSARIEDFFRQPDAKQPSVNESLRFQGHVLLHLLNDSVMPVVRSEVLISLKIGSSFYLEATQGLYMIDCTKAGVKSKTGALALIKLPRSETPLFNRWLKIYRPVLLPANTADPGNVFLTQKGTARTEISYAISKIMSEYIPTRASAHAFRHMQATESKRVGLSAEQHEAMCKARQHTREVAERFYERTNLKRSADVAFEHLEQVREARAAEKKRKVEHGNAGASSSSASASNSSSANATAPVSSAGLLSSFPAAVKSELGLDASPVVKMEVDSWPAIDLNAKTGSAVRPICID